MFEITVEGGEIRISEADVLDRSNEEETIETFKIYEPYLVKVLKRDGKNIIVDWEKLEQVIELANYRVRGGIRVYIYSVLLALNILTKDRKGAYSFSDENLNPFWGIASADFSFCVIGILYFKRKEDAIKYGQVFWSDTLWDWAIYRMGEVVTKSEICK